MTQVKDLEYVSALKTARDLVKSGWTKAAMARAECGTVVDLMAPCAKKWCMLGAMARVTGRKMSLMARFDKEVCYVTGTWTGQFNDGALKVEEVVEVFDKLIARHSILR